MKLLTMPLAFKFFSCFFVCDANFKKLGEGGKTDDVRKNYIKNEQTFSLGSIFAFFSKSYYVACLLRKIFETIPGTRYQLPTALESSR